MINTKIIKQHNKNIEDISNFLEEYKDNYMITNSKNDLSYIKSIKSIFSSKKLIVNCYNKLVDIYNKTISKINNINFQTAENKSLIKTCEKIAGEIDEQFLKMKQICDANKKPDNYDDCLKLKAEREKCEKDLTAVIRYSVPEQKTVESQSHSHVGGTYSNIGGIFTSTGGYEYTSTHYETVTVYETKTYPDEETREKARKRIEEIDNEIKEIPNYNHNLQLEDLYVNYENLKRYTK